jgi:hypothetical protein
MDLGSAFAASVMRQPRQEAFVEGNIGTKVTVKEGS